MNYNKPLTLILFLLLLTNICAHAQQKRFSIEAGPEYRTEDFRWSIAGNMQGTNPNILSELIFKPVNAFGFYTNGRVNLTEKFSLNVHYNRLFTYDGEVTDFDYNDDNRTDPKTQLYLQSDKGDMRTVGMQFNYHFFNNNNFAATTGLGYNHTKELFYLTNDNDPLLQSTYRANWDGPNLALKGLFDFGHFNLGAGVTGHYLFYNAKANWNLVEEFQHPVSFRHKAQGHGFDYRLTFGLRPLSFLNIGLHLLHSNWKTGYGTDKLYMASGDIYNARLNGAFKKNLGLRLNTTFNF